jgi:hypothetical protein
LGKYKGRFYVNRPVLQAPGYLPEAS